MSRLAGAAASGSDPENSRSSAGLTCPAGRRYNRRGPLENGLHPLDAYPRQRPDLAARVIGGEAVVVTPSDSQVHELNAAATWLFEACDGRRSGWQLVDGLTAAFEVDRAQASRDVAALLDQLRDRGLVDLLPAPT